MSNMFNHIMSNLSNAIDNYNSKSRAINTIEEYLTKILGDTNYELLTNERDNDLKIKIIGDCLGTDLIEDIQDMFKITFIIVENGDLEIDLRLKE